MINTHSDGPCRAILFDLDGTLVDSLPDLAWALGRLLADLGRPAPALAEVRRWVGDGATVLVQRGVDATGGADGHDPAALVARFIAYYRDHAAVDSQVYPGVLPTLAALKRDGYRLGVCTNKPTALSHLVLSQLGFGDLFAAVVGGDTAVRRKPHPDHLRQTLEAMGCSGVPALMVGDSRNDVASAQAAGLPVVMVGFGYCQAPPATMGADVVIEDFAQLPAVVRQLL
jgi:phosphoglycolate phosphatase